MEEPADNVFVDEPQNASERRRERGLPVRPRVSVPLLLVRTRAQVPPGAVPALPAGDARRLRER